MERAELIEQVATLFPYLDMAERIEWWKRIDCDLVELTKYMPTTEQLLEEIRKEKGL